MYGLRNRRVWVGRHDGRGERMAIDYLGPRVMSVELETAVEACVFMQPSRAVVFVNGAADF